MPGDPSRLLFAVEDRDRLDAESPQLDGRREAGRATADHRNPPDRVASRCDRPTGQPAQFGQAVETLATAGQCTRSAAQAVEVDRADRWPRTRCAISSSVTRSQWQTI